MPITQPLPIQNLIAEITELTALAPGAPVPYPANYVGVEARLDALQAELARRVAKGDQVALAAAEILWGGE